MSEEELRSEIKREIYELLVINCEEIFDPQWRQVIGIKKVEELLL